MKGRHEIWNERLLLLLSSLVIFLFGNGILLTVDCAAGESIPKSIPSESGDYCNVRCIAKCIRDNGNGAGTRECEPQCGTIDNTLCAAGDHACWNTCKNRLPPADQATAPKPPANLSVANVRIPEPNPREVNVQWEASSNAQLYIIQYVDKSDSFKTWANGGLGMNISYTNHWKFTKQNLCPEYAFRVAAVNENGVSDFSRIVNLAGPEPIVPAAQYSVRSAQLLNEPFIDPAIDSVALDNHTVQLVISFAPPPHWDMKRDIKRVSGTLHVLFCNRLQPFAPFIRWITGESEFQVRLPGSAAAEKGNCKILFAVESLYSKCNEAEPIAYPAFTVDQETNQTQPGFTFALGCSNIHGSECPYVPISSEPACGVNNERINTTRSSNNSNDALATVSFDRPYVPKDGTIRFYQVRYGEASLFPYNPTAPDTFRLPNITGDVKVIILPNDTQEFNIPDLDIEKSYAFQICALYDEHKEPNWNTTGAYLIDLSNLRRPGDELTSADRTRARTQDYRLAGFVAAVAVPIIVVLIVALGVFTCVLMRRRRAKSIDELKVRPLGWDDDRYIDLPEKLDKWELDRQHLIIYDDQKLGSGAFGSVFKCKLLGPLPERAKGARSVLAEYRARVESGEAAAKLLPEFADETSKSDFRREINLMKHLGYHERLVNMLGCISVSEPLCLVVEYCQEGDLLHYLRDRRNYMIKLEEDGIDLNNLAENDQVNLELVLCFKDLMSFSWQISVGLEYLSQKGYIHRDVAARNVLVDKGKRAKIGDFGLCRYSYDDSVYLSHGGRLPIKWMALEAIKSYEFTPKSDVWSYGVLLFEIITMGGNPYPGIQPTDVELYLEAGNRMEQPDNCPPVLYSMMLDCWRLYPDERPTFTELRERLRVLLEEVTLDYSYLSLNQARDYYNVLPPVEYPTLTSSSIPPPQSRQSQRSVQHNVVNEDAERNNQKKSQYEQNTNTTNEKNNLESLKVDCEPAAAAAAASPKTSDTSSCGSAAATPSALLSNGQHRDSAGSEQYLITPTTPKFKFFKFKAGQQHQQPAAVAHKNGLAVLPETSRSGSDGDDNLSYSNGAYIEDLMPPPPRPNQLIPPGQQAVS